MDPTQTLIYALSAMLQAQDGKESPNGARSEAMEALEDLRKWLYIGGFMPDARKAIRVALEANS